jgi:hypothetical protein
LFYNDEILQNILSNNETKPSSTTRSIIELFASLLFKFYPKRNLDNDLVDNYTCVVILNLFWLISNHEKYRPVIRDCEQLMDLMKNAVNDEQSFKDTFMPRTMKSIQQAAKDILGNVNSES